MTKSKVGPSNELPILSFDSDEQWEKWLALNHSNSNGVWLCFQKKSSDKVSPSYAEALDTALCYGWIDGQKFTHRRPRSGWSKKNTENVGRLISAGRMQASGLAEVEAAKKDGRWKAAYDSPSKATIPDDFIKALSRNKKAQAFFLTLNKANLYSVAYRLQTAKKPETREKRMKAILELMNKGEKFH